MKSMTGFGRGVASVDGRAAIVQVNAVNRKSLEVGFSMPREWQALEPELAAVVRGRVARGRVHVAVELDGGSKAGSGWDDAAVGVVLDRLSGLAAARGIAFKPTPELLFQIAEASVADGGKLDPARALELLRPPLEEAVLAMVEMRIREGAALEEDIVSRLQAVLEMVDAIETRCAAVVPAYRDGLLQRLRQMGLELDLGDERVLKEIALFADRADISEEIVRLRSHLEQLSGLAGRDEPVGRKAEFILQEVSREFHTIGSKANDLEIARAVIEGKNELERIREQVQNVE